MADDVIVTESLGKMYEGRAALSGLSLRVPRASVFGFLGPNGAGKTTTIRLLLGLQRATSGTAQVLGRVAGDRAGLARLGALVEMPSLYPNLTGMENMRVTAHYRGCDIAACRSALELVGLMSAAGRRVKGYSLGMRQRLGLATALMHGPELLILDEPTNGLDPEGIIEMRALIRTLAEQRGVTVFVSSHLLTEIEQISSHLAVLSQRKLRYQGTTEALRGQCRARLVIGVSSGAAGIAALGTAGIAAELRPDGRLEVDSAEQIDQIAVRRINALLVGAGVGVDHLGVERPSLEDQFLEMTRATP